MRMEKRKLRIGEFAQYLGVECFVIRYWEKEFKLNAQRSTGKQRFYSERDIKKFELIKDLLYNKKFTIAGAKKYLKEKSLKKTERAFPDIIPAHMIKNSSVPKEFQVIIQQIHTLQKHLLKLRELL